MLKQIQTIEMETEPIEEKKESYFSMIERVGLIILGIGIILGFIFASVNFTVGIAAGGLLAALNFKALVWLAKKLKSAEGRKELYLGLILFKFGILIAAIYLVMKYIPMDYLGFIIGLSVIFVVIVIDSYRRLLGQKQTN